MDELARFSSLLNTFFLSSQIHSFLFLVHSFPPSNPLLFYYNFPEFPLRSLRKLTFMWSIHTHKSSPLRKRFFPSYQMNKNLFINHVKVARKRKRRKKGRKRKRKFICCKNERKTFVVDRKKGIFFFPGLIFFFRRHTFADFYLLCHFMRAFFCRCIQRDICLCWWDE